MAKYTLELRDVLKGGQVFDVNSFNFYTDNILIKQNFIDKFNAYFYFREICCTPIARFKFLVNEQLNRIMPYYTQLYETELESKGITFLLNKDLTETFSRDVVSSSKGVSNSTNNSDLKANTNVKDNNKAITSDTPQNRIDDINQYMSSAVQGEGENNTSSDSKTIDKSVSENSDEGLQNETTTLISRGNIGTTSSAELLEKWREVLINIDELILYELTENFMQIY